MKTVKAGRWVSIVMASLLIMFGCGKKTDENKPVSEIKAEAAKMDPDDLRRMALEYKKAIQAKMDEAARLKSQIKDIPLKEMLGEKAKQLKQELGSITDSVKALKERFNVYLAELKKKGGDLTGLNW